MNAPESDPPRRRTGAAPEAAARAGPAATARARLVESIRNPSLPILLGFAVVVAIVVGLRQTTPAPDAIRLLPSDPGEAAAALPTPVPGPLREAIAAYGAGDLDGAVDILAATAAEGPADDLRRAYLGSALVRLGRPEEAIDLLAAGLALPEPWRSEARWTHVVALRRAGRLDDADRELRELEAGGGPLAGRARNLLGSAAE